MMRPLWLRELRDLLAITSYDGRQNALMRWEQRWLVELHSRHHLTPLDVHHGKGDIVQWAKNRLTQNFGISLVKVMGDVSVTSDHSELYGTEPVIDVCIDVMAIRREPRVDD